VFSGDLLSVQQKAGIGKGTTIWLPEWEKDQAGCVGVADDWRLVDPAFHPKPVTIVKRGADFLTRACRI